MSSRLHSAAFRPALFVVGLAASASLLSAQGTPAYDVSGSLRVDGGSTVRSWSCEAGQISARVAGAAGSTLTLADVAGAVQSVQFDVPTALLDCSNDTMNDHMWNALERDRHPQIRFRMERYTASAPANGAVRLELRGTLEMLGQSHPITLVANATEAPGGALRVQGVHELNMTRWGVRPPRLMLGTLRVHEDVQVHFDLTVAPR
jgi:polyisoprenoid-binding protein YceI